MKQIGLTLMAILLVAYPLFSQNGTWNQKANIPTARLFTASCELDGKIYVIGGAKTLNSSLNTMEVYDPATDTWDITKTDMPTAREELCVAAVNGKIYAIGGAISHNGTIQVGVVEEYDPLTDTWDVKQSMPTARKGAACGVINDKIYVAGGSAVSYDPSNILEVYDPATDSWTSKANMLKARYAPSGAVLNDTFYVSGGIIGSPWTGQIAVQKYDPIENTWSIGTNLITGRVGHTTNGINGKIYAIGGDKQPPVLDNVEEYDPQTETWTVFDQIPGAMICHTSSVYGNEIYVFSGTTTNINNLKLTNNVYSYTTLVTSIESQKNLTPDVFVLLQIYPNPTKDLLTIETENSDQYSIDITSLNGQLIYRTEMEGIQHQIDLSPYQKGVYLITLRSKDFVTTRKIIKL